jgi:FKBP-type peptidyl-prolyl cis-trans isomerase
MIHRNTLKHLMILSGIVMMALLSSCDPTKGTEDLEEEETLRIHNFLSNNDTLDFELKESGLYYCGYIEGTGLQAETHDTAYVFYAMQNLSGTYYESNMGTEDTLIFPVNEGRLLLGFDEGITYMKEGGISFFLMPSKLAFGTAGTYYIAPYSPFIFRAELVKLVKHL